MENNNLIENNNENISDEDKSNTNEKDNTQNKFKEKAELQINKIIKEITNLSNQGAKSGLSESEINLLIKEIRGNVNDSKKQYEEELNKKDSSDFGVLNNSISKLNKEIKILGDLSSKHSGEFTEEHIQVMFEAIKKYINLLKKNLKENEDKNNNFSF